MYRLDEIRDSVIRDIIKREKKSYLGTFLVFIVLSVVMMYLTYLVIVEYLESGNDLMSLLNEEAGVMGFMGILVILPLAVAFKRYRQFLSSLDFEGSTIYESLKEFGLPERVAEGLEIEAEKGSVKSAGGVWLFSDLLVVCGSYDVKVLDRNNIQEFRKEIHTIRYNFIIPIVTEYNLVIITKDGKKHNYKMKRRVVNKSVELLEGEL